MDRPGYCAGQDARLELTVTMPAHNSEKFIAIAIESILRQKDVEFELVVLDDASTDRTAEIVESFQDSRIRLLKNAKKKGIGGCHNRILAESNAPFVAHVDSDDIVLRGAFRKLIDKLKENPRLGQVHCHYVDVDERGTASLRSVLSRTRSFLERRPPGNDYKKALFHGCIINHLRTYRREALQSVGPFNEEIPYDVDYEMALRLADPYDLDVVPEFLYCFRIHRTNTTESLQFKNLRFLWIRIVVWRHVWRTYPRHFLRRRRVAMAKYIIIRLGQILRIPGFRRQDADATNGKDDPKIECLPPGLPSQLQYDPVENLVRVVLKDTES